MKAKGLVFMFLAMLLMLSGTPVYANGVPSFPHAFYGSITIDGEPAPVGAVISAAGDGVETNTLQNPITTTVEGSYGIDSKMLLVQAEEGAVITFYVNGISANQTIEWQSDTTTRVDLSVTTGTPPGDGGTPPSGGGTPPTDGGELASTLFGTEETFAISNDGEVLEAIAATSADGTLTVTIPEGTIAKDENDNPLSSVGVAVDNSPPSPPEDANIIGLAYNFGPDGAVFSPPITLEYSYDPDALPEGVHEEDLVIAYYDEDAGEWAGLACTVDTENNTITASVSHFTTFAIIGTITPPAPAALSISSLSIHPTQVQPKETVTITVSVANTGGTEESYTVVLKVNGLKETERSVTVASGSSQSVTFSLTKEEPGSYSVAVDELSGSFTVAVPAPPPGEEEGTSPSEPTPEPPVLPPSPPAPTSINWPVLGGIIAGVVVVGLLIFFLVRRRAY